MEFKDFKKIVEESLSFELIYPNNLIRMENFYIIAPGPVIFMPTGEKGIFSLEFETLFAQQDKEFVGLVNYPGLQMMAILKDGSSKPILDFIKENEEEEFSQITFTIKGNKDVLYQIDIEESLLEGPDGALLRPIAFKQP